MIKTVADLLDGMIRTEEQVLAKHRITHGPTIGQMYEGLTKKVVGSSVFPKDLPLAVVTGFVEGKDGKRSDEQDVMIVVGEGERIPNTDSFIFPTDQVLACVEVKKTLGKDDVAEGVTNLDTLRGLRIHGTMDILESIRSGFQKITGHLAPARADVQKIPPLYQHIWHHVTLRRAMPCRILLGYQGYKTERGLRSGISEYINGRKKAGAAFGPLYLPDAILNLHGSVVANAAAPWSTMVEDESWWPLLMSNSTIPPVEVLLEVIWTRLLDRGYVTAHIFGEDLQSDPWHRFVDAKYVADPKPGWMYRESPFSAKIARKTASLGGPIEWEPAFVSKDGYILASLLTKVESLDLSTLQWPEAALHKAVDELLSQQIIGRSLTDPNVVGLITTELLCVITSKGEFVVGENVSGRLVRSLQKTGRLGTGVGDVNAIAIKSDDGQIKSDVRLLPKDGIGWTSLVEDVFPARTDGSNDKGTTPSESTPKG